MKLNIAIATLVIFLTVFMEQCPAITVPVPEIPKPTMSMVQVLQKMQQMNSGKEGITLLSIDWCKISSFRPRVTDGTQYHPGNDDPEGYSWFITLLVEDPKAPEALRLHSDGSSAVLVGTRT